MSEIVAAGVALHLAGRGVGAVLKQDAVFGVNEPQLSIMVSYLTYEGRRAVGGREN